MTVDFIIQECPKCDEGIHKLVIHGTTDEGFYIDCPNCNKTIIKIGGYNGE